MIYFMIMTAFTVSIDSFICGLSLSLSTKKKLPVIFGIVTTVFIMCCAVNYLTTFFADKLTETHACLGGVVLIAVGIFNMIKSTNKSSINEKSALGISIITGFAVGLDGALANLSLSLMGLNDFFVPLTIAFFHGLMIGLGLLLTTKFNNEKLAKIEFLPPVILILLGCYKLLGLII